MLEALLAVGIETDTEDVVTGAGNADEDEEEEEDKLVPAGIGYATPSPRPSPNHMCSLDISPMNLDPESDSESPSTGSWGAPEVGADPLLSIAAASKDQVQTLPRALVLALVVVRPSATVASPCSLDSNPPAVSASAET